MSGISQTGRFYFGSPSPAPLQTKPDSRAVAAAAELSGSKLPVPGATPGTGQSTDGAHGVTRPTQIGNAHCACRCGWWKESDEHLVCKRCWFDTPLAIRQLVHYGSLKDRRAAVRIILETAQARGVMATL